MALAAMLSVSVACTSEGGDSDPTAGAPPGQAAVDLAVASGVGVLALGCGPTASGGSGVVLGNPGQVVTVAHTVAGASSVIVVDAAGTQFGATVVAFDPASDLAVLSVDGLEIVPLAVAAGDAQRGSATLVTWSVDGGVVASTVEITQRLAITIDDIYGEQSVQRSGFEFAGDVVVGDSGGPVVDASGGVVGIVYARSQSRADTGFATDATEINALLEALANQAVDQAGDQAGDQSANQAVDNGACV